MSKEELLKDFDVNGPGRTGNLFGLPFSYDDSELVVVPVPWEVTVSYRSGTAKAPKAILAASSQVDLAVRGIDQAWKLGIFMQPFPESLYEENCKLRELSAQYILALEAGEQKGADDPVLAKINHACENLNIYVKSQTAKLIQDGKMVALLGGDHSTPLGFLRALAEKYNRFGILQIDAHADLRRAYEGFTYSHASIMYNAMKLPAIARLVQVGIRDFGEDELVVMQRSMGRIVTHFDQDLKRASFGGANWDQTCDKIIADLPNDVYISFDIDGLDPKLCPNTGTPVPGGLEFEQAAYLITKVVASGRRIIGFDLNEVVPGKDNDWDANVGARLLYHLCNWMAVSQGKLVAGGR